MSIISQSILNYTFVFWPLLPILLGIIEKIMDSGGLAPVRAMVDSSHLVMQNEALIALAILVAAISGKLVGMSAVISKHYFSDCNCRR